MPRVAHPLWPLFDLRLRFVKEYADRDRIFAPFAPVTLLMLPFVWLMLVGAGSLAQTRSGVGN